MFIPIILGSEADRPHAEKIISYIQPFGVETEIKVCSAHKVPEKLVEYINQINAREDAVVYITCAGRSNGLSGCTSGSATHPVIACPPFSDKADYNVNIHSTVMMPSDTPAMTVVDPQNAAIAAVKILALTDADLKAKVEAHIQEVKAKFS
ncbi:AIR carboxylase family protein [Candidatus Peregrinibacteria bacterium]|nr:MAG: AIR carboxylase family protein [Candidatus Peregrinibacteria bacterium]